MDILNEWECELCCKNEHCGHCNCCVNAMNELAKKRAELVTVLCESYDIDKETGLPVNQRFLLYSAPCLPDFAASIAENLKRAGKSFRIMEKDGRGRIIAQWLRPGFTPSDGRNVEI